MNNKPVDTPKRQSATTGLESLEQAPSSSNATTVSASQNGASNFSSIQKRPSRPWKKQAILIVVLLLFVGGLSFAALRLSAKINQGTNSQDLAGFFKPVGNPVLGAESILPVQSLNDKTVTINGDLTVNGKLKLSAEAINDLAGVVGNKVSLSPTQGGPVQTGNISISGTVVASNFQGNGAGLSNLNASSVTSGTLSNDRLDASVTRLGQTIPLSALQSTVLSSLNGISNNGNVDIVGSGSLSVTTDLLNNQIVLSTSSGGDITSVIAGTGLIGGGATGDVTLDIDTGLVTVQGNTFNGASQLVKLNGAGELPVLSATNLTNLNASNLGTGTLNDARLGANVTLQGNTFNLANKLVKLDNSGNLPALNGSAITNLNAGNLGTGTLDDARLSANVALLDANQTFTGNVAFSQSLQVNTIQPSAAMTIGATNQSLTLQGDLTTSLTGTGGTGTVSLGFTGTPVGTIAYQLDASAPAGTYTLCTTVGNCAGSGTGVTSLGGTTNKLAKFTGGQAIDDSSITDDGTLVTVGANALYKAGADSTTAFRIQNAAGSNNVFTADSTNNRVAIGQATAGYTLDVNGDINSATGLRVGGNLVCDSNGCAASGQSGFYIQNGTATQSAANFNIESTSNSTPTAVLKLKSSQTADLLQARDASNNVIAKIDASGNVSTTGQFQVSGTQISSANLSNDANLAKLNGTQTFTAANLFRNAGDSTTAFRIQNAAASNLFVADTSNTRIAIGQATAGYTLDVNGDINITNGSSYRINGVAICGPTATCAPSSGSGSYVQNGLVSQTANFNIQSISSNSIVGILQGAVGQSADLFQARDSSNNVVFKIANSGITTITGTGISGSSLTLTPSTGNNFIIGGTNITVNPSNVLNLQGATASLATTVGHGNVTLSSLGVARLTVQDANSGGKIGIGNNMSSPQAQLHVLSSGSTVIGQIIQGAASQTADLFQARDSNNNVLAKITSSGAIYQGANQVCDASNNCNFATGSGSGNYIQNTITTQTANMNIQSASTTSPTAVIQGANAQTADILQVKDSIGNNLISTNQTTPNLVTNSSFDTNTAGWTAKGNAAISVSTAEKYIGNSSIQMVLTTAEDGIRFNYPLASSTTYTLSYYGKATTAINGTRCGRSDDGSTNTNGAVSTPNYPSTGWIRFTCTFTTGTTSGAPYFYIGRSVGGGTVFIDAVQLEVGSSATPYQMGTISLNGVVKSPTSFRNQSDSATAFQVQNAAGTSIFNIDTVGGAVQTNLIQASYALALRAGGGGYVNLQDGSGRSILTSYSDTGATTLRSYVANSGAFQIKDVNANTILNVDTTGNRNLITNPSFEADTAGWSITAGGSSLLRITTDQYSGLSSVRNTNTATANTGGRFLYQLAASSTYTFSMYAKAEGSNFSTLELGYNTDGTTYTSCLTAQTVVTTGWTRYSCTFTMPGTVSSNRFVYFRQTDATARSFLVDAFQLEAGSAATNYSLGNLSLNGTVTGPTVFQNQSNSTAAFQIQNASGNQVLNIDTTSATNLITNPSFDTNTSGWTAGGSATLSRVTTDQNQGAGALQVNTTAAVNDGVRYPYALAASTTYTFSFHGRGGSGGITMGMGYSADGTTLTACTPVGLAASSWSKRSCTFTTPSSVSGTRFVYIQQTDAAARYFLVDTAMLEVGASASSLNAANISINGAINTPLLLQGSGNSTVAFQVQNTAGTAVLRVDTVNSAVTIGSGTGSANQGLTVTDAARIQNVVIGGSDGASTLRGSTGSGGTINLQNTASQSFAFTSYANTSATNVFQFNATPSSTAENLLQVQRGGTAVATVGNSGSLLLKNQYDTSTAFQIQNAVGSTVLNVNTAVNASTWTTTTAFTTARARGQTLTYNGKMYILGGQNTSVARSDVQYAPINGDGSVGTWTSTTAMPVGKTAFSAVAYNGYMYTLGGYDPATNTYFNDVRVAPINGDGTLGSWTSTTSFTTLRGGLSAVANNGYMYITGGNNASNGNGQTVVQYAPINGDGTLGSWTDTSPLATGRISHYSVVNNGYLYVFGGYNTISDVSYVPINGDGTLGTWATTTALPAGRYYHTGTTYNGKVYIMGGSLTGNNSTNDVLTATFNGNGTIGSWSSLTGFTTPRNHAGSVAYNGRLYIAGGAAGLDYFGTFYNDVQYTTLTSSAYNNSISINGLLTNSGPAIFKNGSDSDAAFSVQNSAAASIFQVDTTNSRVGIGNASPGNLLSVGALTLADPDAQLAVGTGGDSKKGIVIQAVAGQTADFFQAQDSTGAVLASIDPEGNLAVRNVTVSGHIISAGPVPTMELVGTATGTAPLSQIFGTDVAGVVVLAADVDGTGSGAFIHVTFAEQYTGIPMVVLTPSSEDAAILTGSSAVYAYGDPDGAGFTIAVGPGGLPTNVPYAWTYHVIQ